MNLLQEGQSESNWPMPITVNEAVETGGGLQIESGLGFPAGYSCISDLDGQQLRGGRRQLIHACGYPQYDKKMPEILMIPRIAGPLRKSVTRFLHSEDGPTAVEYAVMLALIVIVCLTAVRAIGTNASAKFNQVKNALT